MPSARMSFTFDGMRLGSQRYRLDFVSTFLVFWAVFILKLILSALFTSDYLKVYFIPFVDYFVNTFDNPYRHFWEASVKQAFPYPAAMLYIMSIPRLLAAPFHPDGWPLMARLLLYRIPLFAADFAIFLVLANWMWSRIGRVVILYWASPVLIYISYVHGQLDAIPIALLVVSLYFLFGNRRMAAALLFGLALACKTHVIVGLPFFLLYIWRKEERIVALLPFLAIAFAAFLLPNLPFLGDKYFFDMVFRNAEQNKTLLAFIALTEIHPKIYLVPFVYGLLLLYAFSITVKNRDVFIMFIGFSFGALLFFIPPMQGWYYWTIRSSPISSSRRGRSGRCSSSPCSWPICSISASSRPRTISRCSSPSRRRSPRWRRPLPSSSGWGSIRICR